MGLGEVLTWAGLITGLVYSTAANIWLPWATGVSGCQAKSQSYIMLRHSPLCVCVCVCVCVHTSKLLWVFGPDHAYVELTSRPVCFRLQTFSLHQSVELCCALLWHIVKAGHANCWCSNAMGKLLVIKNNWRLPAIRFVVETEHCYAIHVPLHNSIETIADAVTVLPREHKSLEHECVPGL